jgi:hypothetical protein
LHSTPLIKKRQPRNIFPIVIEQIDSDKTIENTSPEHYINFLPIKETPKDSLRINNEDSDMKKPE